MRLNRALVRLPLCADAVRLAEEIAGVGDAVWRDHPEGAAGNTALPVVAADGDPDNDSTKGPMAPTPVLAHLPYTRQVLAGLPRSDVRGSCASRRRPSSTPTSMSTTTGGTTCGCMCPS